MGTWKITAVLVISIMVLINKMDTWYALDVFLVNRTATWIDMLAWADRRFGPGLLFDPTSYHLTDQLWAATIEPHATLDHDPYTGLTTAKFKFKKITHRAEFIIYWGHLELFMWDSDTDCVVNDQPWH